MLLKMYDVSMDGRTPWTLDGVQGLTARGWWTTIIQETWVYLSVVEKEGIDGCQFRVEGASALSGID